jgi:uncharacterized membrane protein YcaP (DUF421 family)
MDNEPSQILDGFGVTTLEENSVRDALIGQWGHLGLVATKAALLFVFVVAALRISPRRTLSDLSVYDFVTAVAVGSIVGRVPNATDASFATGAVTLVVLLVLNRLIAATRVTAPLARIFDHPPAVLVHKGRIDKQALRRERLTEQDLASILRAKGFGDIAEIEYVIFEPGGAISVIATGGKDLVADLNYRNFDK